MPSGWTVETEGEAELQAQLSELQSEFRSMKNYAVVSDVPYAVYVEFGTGPHVIKADDGGTLAFEAGGETVFTQKVQHPGTPPNGALRKAAKSAMANLDAIVDNADSPEEIVHEVAKYIRDGWKQDVWVDTGRLKQSIHVEAI